MDGVGVAADVEAGGEVLVTGIVPLVDDAPAPWVGARLASEPWQDFVYLPWPDAGRGGGGAGGFP